MTSTKEQGFNGQFDADHVEPLVEKVLAAVQGAPANLAGMAIITAMVEMSRMEAEQQDVDSFDGFELQSRVKDFMVKIRVERNPGGLAGLIQELMQRDEGPDMDNPLIGALFSALAKTKDDTESEDYCECPACTDRRAMMAEMKAEEEQANRRH